MTGRTGPAPRRRTAAPVRPARAGLTTRAAVLGLVVCALVVTAALPLREYLSQRGRISHSEAAQRAQRLRVEALDQQLQRWKDPAYVRAQARSRLHYVLPGETSYVVIGPGAAPSPAGTAAPGSRPTSGPASPWYSQVWGSVRAADRPVRVR